MTSESEESLQKLCFVIGPIGKQSSDTRRHADWLLDGIIKPVFDAHFPDFKVERADGIGEPGSISSQVINRLMDVTLVIADMSEHNANAFYELAIRHMKRLRTIHMILKDTPIPFDVAGFRAIFFPYNTFRHLEKARSDLRTAVDEVMKPQFSVENPVTQARARFEIDQHATPETRALANNVDELRRELRELSIAIQFERVRPRGLSYHPAEHDPSPLPEYLDPYQNQFPLPEYLDPDQNRFPLPEYFEPNQNKFDPTNPNFLFGNR